MLGIIGAMEEEVAALKKKMQIEKIMQCASMEFCQGILEGKQVVVVRSGIGKVNAAVCAQILVDRFQVDAMINTGIAGALSNEINIGDIVLSSDTMQHDMDATGFGYRFGEIPRMETSAFEADSQLIELAKVCCKRVNPEVGVHVGRVVSGDQFISNRSDKEWIVKYFGGYCTEMEGAAIAQVAYLNQIPFLIVRAISDKADNSASMDYAEFEKQAIIHSVNLIVEMVNNLAS